MKYLFTLIMITGCEMIEVNQKVVYEDLTPAIETKVHQWNDTADYTTYTNVLGEWSLILPIGSKWMLCIENPRDDYTEACYSGTLIVDSNGDLI